MHILTFATLTVTGFVACAEFGSYSCVHPVLSRLPVSEPVALEQRILIEQGLLKTFGRVMPIGMTLYAVLGVTNAVNGNGTSPWSALAAAAFVAALVSTLIVNVPINLATGRWDPKHPPANWHSTRTRWERFQGFRSWLLLVGFVLFCLAVAA